MEMDALVVLFFKRCWSPIQFKDPSQAIAPKIQLFRLPEKLGDLAATSGDHGTEKKGRWAPNSWWSWERPCPGVVSHECPPSLSISTLHCLSPWKRNRCDVICIPNSITISTCIFGIIISLFCLRHLLSWISFGSGCAKHCSSWN